MRSPSTEFGLELRDQAGGSETVRSSLASAIAACFDGQIATQNQLPWWIQATLKCIIANTIASSTGVVVISDHQLAH